MQHSPEQPAGFSLASIGLRLSEWFERWFPDAFALALAACAIVFAASLAQWFGAGFWDLVAFTMQIAMIIITGYAVAVSPPIYAVIRRMAGVPRNGKSAAAFVALFSMLSSLLSWSFSLIFSGLLAREVAHRVAGADYRALGAAAYLGIGSVWALGLSSSAALIMAAPASLPDSIERISGVIPLGQTLGLWQSLFMAGVLVVVSMIIAYHSAPSTEQARGMTQMGVTYAPPPAGMSRPETPGEWLEYSPLLTLLVSGLGVAYLLREVAALGASVILELNHFVFAFLIAGLLRHWRPRSFVQAIAAAVPSVAGVLVQYPIYTGIVRMMTESGLADRMAQFFVTVSSVHTFPVLVGIYSAFLGFFVPSGRGQMAD